MIRASGFPLPPGALLHTMGRDLFAPRPMRFIPRLVHDRHFRANRSLLVKRAGHLSRHAHATVRSRRPGIRNGADVHTDAVRGEPHPVGHGCAHELSAPRHRVDPGIGIAFLQVATGVINTPVERRPLGDHLFRNGESTRRCGMPGSPGCHPGLPDPDIPTIEIGRLFTEVDLDPERSGNPVIRPIGVLISGRSFR